MKILFLLILIVGGYYAYDYFTAKEVPALQLPVPPERPAALPPVDFADKASVRKLLSEWKSRTLGDPAGGHGVAGTAAINAEVELREIRRRLFDRGIHDESAVADVIQRALRELGVKESEVAGLAGSIMGMR